MAAPDIVSLIRYLTNVGNLSFTSITSLKFDAVGGLKRKGVIAR